VDSSDSTTCGGADARYSVAGDLCFHAHFTMKIWIEYGAKLKADGL